MKQEITNLYEDLQESIENPICFDCFSKQIQTKNLSIDSGTKQLLLNEIKKEYINRSSHTPDYLVKCSLCKKNRVSVCPYCFLQRINNILTEQKLSDKQINHFLEIFYNRQTMKTLR